MESTLSPTMSAHMYCDAPYQSPDGFQSCFASSGCEQRRNNVLKVCETLVKCYRLQTSRACATPLRPEPCHKKFHATWVDNLQPRAGAGTHDNSIWHGLATFWWRNDACSIKIEHRAYGTRHRIRQGLVQQLGGRIIAHWFAKLLAGVIVESTATSNLFAQGARA